uniref:Putative dorsal-ventral patterning protein sog n=1 Tax=Xenopsylla cheopis TaxID=163159 RepID=A0A6M2DS97_XENCH
MKKKKKSMKHFAALLTGRSSLIHRRDDLSAIIDSHNPRNVVATGRFDFHRKNLHYSFYVSDKASRPRALQFLDKSGSILEEHSLLTHGEYQNATGKVCGVWRRVPKEYRRLLKDEKLFVALLWNSDGVNHTGGELILSGRIGRYASLGTELFSSLLEPAPGTDRERMSGAGGTAVVSTSVGATPSIHLTVLFNGIFSPDDGADVPITVRLELVERGLIILDEVRRVRKPGHELNVIEVSSPVSAADMRLLTRGRLALTVESRRRPEALRLQGPVVTRATCEIFQTALHSSSSAAESTTTSGLAWLYLNRDGALVYNIQVDELDRTQTPMITLVDDSGKRRTELEDLTPSLTPDGRVTGTLERLGPRVLEPLYAGNLAVNVATKSHQESLVRGRLIARPVADARDSPAGAILLKRTDLTTPASIVGVAWLSVDAADCSLHYDLSIAGRGSHQRTMELYLEEVPFIAPGAPVSRALLEEEFTTTNIEGTLAGITQGDLARLETGVVFLDLKDKIKNETMLKATLKHVKVPPNCLPHYTDNDVSAMSPTGGASYDSESNSLQGHSPVVISVDPGQRCFHSGRFYIEGAQWKSTAELCTMCSCVYGRVKCDPIKCPPLPKCKPENRKIREGDCCPVCMNNTLLPEPTNGSAPRGCYLGDQFHKAGSSWHPYLPPNGFDTCAVCTCDLITLDIRCPRTQCPPLRCDEKTAIRPDKKACCKVCPEVKAESSAPKVIADPGTVQDQGTIEIARTNEQIMQEGGCKNPLGAPYENGKEWHPWLSSHGEQKCVTCRCKDGAIKCERKRCPRMSCPNHRRANRLQKAQHDAQPHEPIDECCQCRRNRRHHHKNQQQKNHVKTNS